MGWNRPATKSAQTLNHNTLYHNIERKVQPLNDSTKKTRLFILMLALVYYCLTTKWINWKSSVQLGPSLLQL